VERVRVEEIRRTPKTANSSKRFGVGLHLFPPARYDLWFVHLLVIQSFRPPPRSLSVLRMYGILRVCGFNDAISFSFEPRSRFRLL